MNNDIEEQKQKEVDDALLSDADAVDSEQELEADTEEVSEEKEPTEAPEVPDIEQLQSRLLDAERQIADLSDRLLRAKADQENIRRRAEQDVAKAHKYGMEKWVEALLPIQDSLEKATEVALSDEVDVHALLEGQHLVQKMSSDMLEKMGVKALDPKGDGFDPKQHQAMSTVPVTDDVAANSVVAVYQKGYVLNDRLVRPALVVVAK